MGENIWDSAHPWGFDVGPRAPGETGLSKYMREKSDEMRRGSDWNTPILSKFQCGCTVLHGHKPECKHARD